LRDIHIAFHRDFTNLLSHIQRRDVPFSPHPCQRFFVVFVFDASHFD
jgi:hypothetical protein